MNRIKLMVGVLGLVALVTGACAGGSEEQAAPAPASDTAAAAPAAAPEKAAAPETMADKPIFGGVITNSVLRDNKQGWDPHGSRGGQALAQNTGSWWYNGLVARAFGVDVPSDVRDTMPDLAEKWETSNDGTTYTFTLRKGVKFHNKPPVNGRELVADDIKWNFERFLGGPDSYKFQLGDIKAIEVMDKYTVAFHLHGPSAPFMAQMGQPLATITAKEAATTPPVTPGWKLDDEFRAPDGIIGTGPFMFVEHERGSKLIAERNPDYFRQDKNGNQLPYVDRLEYRVHPDKSAALAAFAVGSVDYSGIDPVAFKSFTKANPQILWTELPNSLSNVQMRTDREPFNDVRVRRAIMMGIDQQAIIDTRVGLRTPWTWGGFPQFAFPQFAITEAELGKSAQWWKYNPEAAKALLAEAGFPNGFDTEFRVSNCCLTTYFPELISDQLSRIGINMKVDTVDHAIHIRTSNVGKYEAFAHSALKASEVSDVLLAFEPGNPKNTSHVDDPVLSKMIAEQKRILDPKARFDAIRKIQLYLADQAYIFRIPKPFSISGWQPWLKGFTPHFGNTVGRDLESAWVDKK